MKCRFHEHSRSVVYSWILSYLLLTVVTIILTGFVYVIARNTIETEINNSNRLLLENIRDNIDSSLVEVNDLSMEILSSQEIQNASNLSLVDSACYYKLYKAAQSLSGYKIFKNPFQNYYIYLGKINRVVTPGIVTFGEYYYNGNIANADFSYEQWLKIVNRPYHGEYVMLPYYEVQSDKRFKFALIRSFPTISVDDAVTNIVIMLDFDNILDYGSDDRSLFVLDSNNNVIAQSHPDASFNAVAMPDDHGCYVGDDKEVISYISSRQNDWKYITVTPEYVFWQKASFIRNIMLGEILLSIIGMSLISFYFVRRNYNILREITSFVRTKLQVETTWGGDEYHYIRQALSHSIEQKEEFECRLDRQNLALRISLFTSLLEGRELSVPLDELLTTYDVHFQYLNYSVVAIYIENVNKELWMADRSKILDVYDLAKFAVMNIMEEIINRSHCAYIVEVRELILCIVNTPMAWDTFHKSLETDLANAKGFISQNLDIDLCIAVGGLHEEPEDIHLAYNEAQSAMDYAKVLGRGRTIFFGDIGELAGRSGYYPFEMERRLLNYMRLSDYDAVTETMGSIFSSDLIHQPILQETARFVILTLAANLLRGISATEEEFNQRMDENRRQIDQLMKCKRPIDMQERMLCLIKSVIEDDLSAQKGKDSQLREVVQKFVLDHYTEPALSIGSVAESIGKSPYYISKMFKVQSGSGILDFINKVRIDKAKELLQAGELTQEQIAERIGFTNMRTFQRDFKKLEGVSPGKLKQTAQL